MSFYLKKVENIFKRSPQIVILLVVIIFMIFAMPDFASFSNIMNILKQSCVLMLLSCGMTFAVISGNLDLSQGAMLSLLLCITLKIQPENIPLAIMTPLAIALLFGAINGFTVGSFNANSVIVTLAMMSILEGITLVFTRGALTRGTANTSFSNLGTVQIFNIPLYVILAVSFAVLSGLLLKYTTLGKYFYYIGVNKDAAEITGINSKNIMLFAYVMSGLSVFLATMVLGSRLLAASPVSGKGYEFDALTAILVGGVKLTGGRGTMINTVIGVFLITTMINGLTLLNIPYEYQNVAKGLLVFIAILSDVKAGKANENE